MEHLTPAGLLQTLQVPSQVWDDISMDFIDRLLPSKGKSTTIVVVDHLSKYAHFTAISHPYTAMGVVKVLFDQIFRLHGMPRSIVCDRDPTFTSRFWRELFCLNGTDFNFSSTCHPQLMVKVRWQIGRLKCIVVDWIKWLAWAEYCYNANWHSTLRRTPFEVVYGHNPPNVLAYVPGPAKVAAVEH